MRRGGVDIGRGAGGWRSGSGVHGTDGEGKGGMRRRGDVGKGNRFRQLAQVLQHSASIQVRDLPRQKGYAQGSQSILFETREHFLVGPSGETFGFVVESPTVIVKRGFSTHLARASPCSRCFDGVQKVMRIAVSNALAPRLASGRSPKAACQSSATSFAGPVSAQINHTAMVAG